MKPLYLLLYPVCICMVWAGPFSEFAVTTGVQCDAPDLDEFGTLVWQQWYTQGTSGHWNIYRKSLGATGAAAIVVDWPGNQTAPAVYGDWVVFEHEYAADDHDIYVKDMASGLDPNELAATALDERAPAVHGNVAVWQRLYIESASVSDWDIVAADFTDPEWPLVFNVAAFEANQQAPVFWRNTVVYQDDFYGDGDIYSTDVWLRKSPVEHPVSLTVQDQIQPAVWKDTVVWAEDVAGDSDIAAADMSDPENPTVFFIAEESAAQTSPDIHEHLVVWQDNRNGNWDIYGYNLITGRQFRITDDPANQMMPTIGGGWVAWVDMRTGVRSIWAARLDGTVAAAKCTSLPAGDIDGNGRVDMADLVTLSSNWLACGLEPASACAD